MIDDFTGVSVGVNPIESIFLGNEEIWRVSGSPYTSKLIIGNSEGDDDISKSMVLYRGEYRVIMISGGGSGWGVKFASNYNNAATGGGGAAITGTFRITQGGLYTIKVGRRGKNANNTVNTIAGGDTSLSFGGSLLLMCSGGTAGNYKNGANGYGIGGTPSVNIADASGLIMKYGKNGTVIGGKTWQGKNTAPNSVMYDEFGNMYGWAGVSTFDSGSNTKQPTGGYFELEFLGPIRN